MNFLERTKRLLTQAQLKKLCNSNICVFGCGGVGGYAIEMLVRSGVKNMTVVDCDVVDITNINRQIIATQKTVGQNKVDAIKTRAEEINPKIKIKTINKKFCAQTKDEFSFKKFDFVVDAIDSVLDKVLLIKTVQENNIPLISAMGAGNKIDIPKFEICDIFKTQNDALSKKMRKLLKDEGIKKLTVCYSSQNGVASKTVGSIAYFPAIAGCTIASYVINQIIKEK